MLDKMITGVLARLEANAAAVREQRAAIELERGRDKARDHAGRMLESPEGYSTSPKTAAEDAQKGYARTRREWEEKAGPILELFCAMMIARERRDEMVAWHKEHKAREAARQAGEPHWEVKPFFSLMFTLGIKPRHLVNVRPETLAIICDLIRWDGHDPDMQDAASPMPDVFGIYASRQILEPGQFGDKSRSAPGQPVVPKRHTDPRHYRFDLLTPGHVPAPVDDGQADDVAVANEPIAEAVIPVSDETVTGTTLEGSDGVLATRSAETAISDPEGTPPAVGMEDGVGSDEYALPTHFTMDVIERIRLAADRHVADDPDWDLELQAAAAWFGEAFSPQEIIERVAATPEDARSTPFRYFVEAARTGGLAAGREAYRAATVRRIMFEIVTAPGYDAARRNLKLV